MIDNRKVLAVIAARGGSKGLPGKALADLGGKPVIAWSVEAALQSKLIDRTVVSSDDERIIAAAKAAGCDAPFVRPAAFATDDAPITNVVLHALDAVGDPYDYAVLLQASSPLRNAEDIDSCIRVCHGANAPAAVSVTLASKHPRWTFGLESSGRFQPIVSPDLWDDLRRRRQDFAEAYTPNGAVYVMRVDSFRQTRNFYVRETVGSPMPTERSIDIDTALDLALARALVQGIS